MSSTPSPWPEQVTLPGQSHTAEGPHDLTGMFVMHHAFRRDLAAFEAAVRNTPIGDTGTWRSLQARWTRFGDVLHHHHEIEDVSIWPVLLTQADALGDETGAGTLAAMAAEHAEIDPSLMACTAGFQAMVEHPCTDHRNALDVHVTATRAALLEHLAHEEREALPFLQRVMTVEEFAEAERAAQDGYPARMIPFLLPWVTAGLPAEVAARLLREAGTAYGLLLRLFRPRFSRAEARAFRYT